MRAIIVLWILLGIIAAIVIALQFSITVEIKGGTSTDFILKIKYMGITLYPRPAKKKKKRKSQRKKSKKSKDTQFEFKDDLTKELELPQDSSQITAEKNVQTQASGDTDSFDFSDKQEDTTEEKSVLNPKKKRFKHKKSNSKDNKKSSGGKLQKLKEKYVMIKPYIPLGWKYFKKVLKTIRITNTRIDVTAGKEDAYESAMLYGKIQALLFNLLAVICSIFTVKIKQANVNCVFNENKLDAQGEAVIKVRPGSLIAIAVCVGVNFLIIYLKQKSKKKAKDKAADTQEKAKSESSAA